MARKGLSHAKQLRDKKRLATGKASGGKARPQLTTMAQPTSSAEAGPNQPVVLVLPTQSPDATTNEPDTTALASVAQLSTESTMSDTVEQPHMARLPPTIENIPQEMIDNICEKIQEEPDDGRKTFLALMRVAPASRNSPLRESAAAFLFRMTPHEFPLRSMMQDIMSSKPDYNSPTTTPNLNRRNWNLGPQTKDDLKLFEKATVFLKNAASLSQKYERFLAQLSDAFDRGEISARLAILALLCPNLRHLTLPTIGMHRSNDRVWIDEVLEMMIPCTGASRPIGVFHKLRSITVHRKAGTKDYKDSTKRAIYSALHTPSITNLEILSETSMAEGLNLSDDFTSTIRSLTLRDVHLYTQEALLLGCTNLFSLNIDQERLLVSRFNDDSPSVRQILRSIKRNEPTLQHLSMHIQQCSNGWTGFSSLLPELKKLKSLSVEDWIVRRRDDSNKPQDRRELSFDLGSFPPNLESLTIRTVKHPGMIFKMIADILDHHPNPSLLRSFKAVFRVIKGNCRAPLDENLLEQLLNLSTDIFDLHGVMERDTLYDDYAVVTIHFPAFSQVAIDLRNAVEKWRRIISYFDAIHHRLANNFTGSSNALSDLSDRLNHFGFVM